MQEPSIVEHASFSPELDKLPWMMKWVQEKAEQGGLSKAEMRKIELALEEAFINISHYGALEKGANVDVIVQIIPHVEIVFTLIDQGRPFDPLSVKEPENLRAPAEERIEGGLGIHLMKTFLDRVEYERKEGFNILTLTKKIA
jgi:serine/threonine-protein kinase RsbW